MTKKKKVQQNKIAVQPDLVSYSRAGDTFHYRWAARRCLHLLDFNSNLDYITIESSKENGLGGEYVIDTAEYSSNEINEKTVEYFQLKHSTTQCDKNFTLSSLKGTIEGFASRFRDIENQGHNFTSIKFTVITNRPISENLKKSIKKLATGKSGGVNFDKTIKAYTKLNGKKLANFCGSLQFVDGEGDYDAQKHELQKELSRLTCESNDVKQLLSLVELVRARIEPKSKIKFINKDDVLEQFELNSEKDLFPAPPLFETLSAVIEREQHNRLYQTIIDPQSKFMIFTAVGGTGKSITCIRLANLFNDGSLALAYDCFGNGGYRKLSEPRHRVCDAFVQITNELAQRGLCEPMLPVKRDQDDRLTQAFLSRLSQSIDKLRESNKEALLIILFDAVDNAEMAAFASGDKCFASHLLRENLPIGCRVVYFSRPERVHLFNPPASIPQIEIQPFSVTESLQYLQTKYPQASLENAIEFCRLTDGNPRVQANALALGRSTIQELLGYFGAGGKTVDDLIEEQLNNALIGIKEQYPIGFEQHVEDICTGLATLPPFVPLEVLAAASGTSISAVKSFIADLGRPLWLTDNYVQFRDEPTETWFTSTYTAKTEQIKTYISRIEPLANSFSYVAEALPSLLLKSEQYKALVELALSEDKLPVESPVEARSIQVYRLQFAFKAALKNQQYLDACKLALRAGEEVAGSDRQMEVLSGNIDLAIQFLPTQRVIELAHQRNIRGQWNGSETLYSAALLASIPECEGEARSYLRSGWHWLNRYFEERNKEDKASRHDVKLVDNDVLAMFFCYYYLDGDKAAVDFIQLWNSNELIYRVTCMFAARLVDMANFEVLERMAHYGKDCPSFVIAITHELMKVGRTPDKKCLIRSLNKIVGTKKWLSKSNELYDTHHISTSAYLSLLEACVINKLPQGNVKRALNYYVNEPRIYSINEAWHDGSRSNFFRSIAIRASINNNYDLSVDEITPKSWIKDQKTYQEKEELKKAKAVIEALLPWYMVRAKLLSGKKISIDKWHKQAQEKSSRILNSRYQEYDPLPFEITEARFFNLVLSNGNVESELIRIIEDINCNKIKFRHQDKISALRIASRQPRLKVIADILENTCFENLQVINEDESPIDHANNLIFLSRAVLALSPADSQVYFEKAIEAVSRFGDEAYERWEAVNNIAKKSVINVKADSKCAYRFMRCAELIGDTIGREKKWDRDGAMETCVQISPQSAFAIASRWKDRDVGRAGRMLSALLETAVSLDAISPSSAWALSAFSFDYDLVKFAEQCIGKERDNAKKQYILNNLIIIYRQQGITGEAWKNIEQLAKNFGLHHEVLNDLEILVGKTNDDPSPSVKKARMLETVYNRDYEKLYANIDFLSDTGLREALNRFEALKGPRDFEGFWKYASTKVFGTNAVHYLSLVVSADYFDLYDIRHAIKYFPDNLKKKPSVQKAWPNIVKTIAKRFPEDFIRYYSREWVLNDIGTDAVTINAVNEGVFQSLSESNGLESSSTFYGFAGYYSAVISPAEAAELLDFALARFELHIDDEYADGFWTPDLNPPAQIVKSLTGYIWANLGSPQSSERWCAMHVVKRLYELECQEEIDTLLEWMSLDHAAAFISKKYPFYNKHAKQYLLMAFARCVIDNPVLLIKHHHVFSDIAVNGEPHILIQKYAADIVLAIVDVKPKIYKKLFIATLEKIGKTPFPIETSADFYENRDTPWHQQGKVDTSLDLSFAFDFDQYWFEPLGQVFKVSSSQVQELAAEVVLKEWQLSFPERYIRDPRQKLWSARRDRETSYSHSSYPRTDSYNFYLSYHAMLVVAAKLLNAMPVVHTRDWYEDEWQDWLDRHLLTRKDGRWLADSRDFIPAGQRQWVNDKSDKDWCWQIWPKDFLEMLLFEYESNTWLNVAGFWNEYRDGRDENVHISSRLVPSHASASLQQAIIHYESHVPGSNSLDNFDNQDDENVDHLFKLKRWYGRGDCYNRIDEFDPYAGAIEYPPYILNQDIVKQFNLSSDGEYRHWLDHDGGAILINQLWSENKPLREDSDYCCKGNRLQASLKFLKTMCEMQDADLVIQVDIKRQLTGIYRDRDNDVGYSPPYRKIYIFSKDGELRDTKTYFKLREKVS